MNAAGGIALPEAVEEQDGRKQDGRRIGDSLAGNIEYRAVEGLEDGGGLADVRAVRLAGPFKNVFVERRPVAPGDLLAGLEDLPRDSGPARVQNRADGRL